MLLTQRLTERQLGLHVLTVVAHDTGPGRQFSATAELHVTVYLGNATAAGEDGLSGPALRNVVRLVELCV